jgi:hypothetical protein
MRIPSRRVIATTVALSSASVALAGGWGPPVTITGYYAWASGGAFITTSNNQNPDSCSSSHYLFLDSTQTNFKAIWAQIIAAQSQGQTVSLSYSGCSGSYPLINAVAIPNVW